jgi:hypothetical protein
VNFSNLRPRPTYANVTASLALFLALGGGAYAAANLPANSVGSRQLRTGAVQRAKIKNNAVNGTKVLNSSLTGEDIAESTLGKVPSAAAADAAANAAHANVATNASHADAATNASHAGAAAALDAATYRSVTVSAPASSPSTTATATCAAGQHVVGGGVKVNDPTNMLVDDSYPDTANTAWTAHVANGDATAHDFTVYAICITVATVS